MLWLATFCLFTKCCSRYFFFVVEQVYVIFLCATTFDDFLWFCSQSLTHHMLLTTLQELLTVHIAWCTMYNVFNTLYCWYVLFGLYDLLLLRSFSYCPRTIYKHKLSRTTRSHHFLFTNHVFTRCYEYSSYLSRSTLQYIISSIYLIFVHTVFFGVASRSCRPVGLMMCACCLDLAGCRRAQDCAASHTKRPCSRCGCTEALFTEAVPLGS